MIGIGISPFFSNRTMSNAKEIKYLFIDGACLDDILTRIGNELFNGDKINLRYEVFGHIYDKVFYYDALPRKNKNESNEEYAIRYTQKESFLNSLKLLNKFHVYEGVVLERREHLNQKAVDIMIAVDMLRHSFRRNMNKATLLTGDLDFKPLLDALVLEGMFTTVWYDPRITSKELLYAADSNQIFDLSTIYTYASDFFKEKHPAPNISHGEFANLFKSYTKLISRGRLNNIEVNLCQNERQDDYLFTYSEYIVGGKFAIYPDSDFLTRWFEYQYNGKVVWEKK